jgi:hypothetical protein
MGHDLPLNSPLDIIPYYLDSFNTNYIIFRNVEIFPPKKKGVFNSKKSLRENIDSSRFVSLFKWKLQN